MEWDYGEYEGRTTAAIHHRSPNWDLFRDGCPGGEKPQQVADRADHVVEKVRAIRGDVLLFSSGHSSASSPPAGWRLEPAGGRYFLLGTASLSALGYEHNPSQPVIRFWDDTRHVGA